MTWYIIDETRGSIVNAITASDVERALGIVAKMDRAEHLRLVVRPPKALLDRYYAENPELGW